MLLLGTTSGGTTQNVFHIHPFLSAQQELVSWNFTTYRKCLPLGKAFWMTPKEERSLLLIAGIQKIIINKRKYNNASSRVKNAVYILKQASKGLLEEINKGVFWIPWAICWLHRWPDMAHCCQTHSKTLWGNEASGKSFLHFLIFCELSLSVLWVEANNSPASFQFHHLPHFSTRIHTRYNLNL